MSFFSRLLKGAARVVVGTAVAGITGGLSLAVGANLKGVGSKIGNSLFGLAKKAFGVVKSVFTNRKAPTITGAPENYFGRF